MLARTGQRQLQFEGCRIQALESGCRAGGELKPKNLNIFLTSYNHACPRTKWAVLTVFFISQLTESEISSLYERLSSLHGRRLMAFYQVRSLFAQIVEGVILLDRLVAILQQVCSFTRPGKYRKSLEIWMFLLYS